MVVGTGDYKKEGRAALVLRAHPPAPIVSDRAALVGLAAPRDSFEHVGRHGPEQLELRSGPPLRGLGAGRSQANGVAFSRTFDDTLRICIVTDLGGWVVGPRGRCSAVGGGRGTGVASCGGATRRGG